MEWEGDEGRGRHARREENVLDVGRAQESQNLRSRGTRGLDFAQW